MTKHVKKKKLRQRKKERIVNNFDRCVGDLFKTNKVQMMKDIKHHLGLNCLDHSLFVSYVGYRICRLLKLDYESAARGGLLHDLFLYDWRGKGAPQGWHGTVHPKVALENAEELCSPKNDMDELNDVEKDIIIKHMWPLTKGKPMYMESAIICFVDKVCALAELTFIFNFIKFRSKYFEMTDAA